MISCLGWPAPSNEYSIANGGLVVNRTALARSAALLFVMALLATLFATSCSSSIGDTDEAVEVDEAVDVDVDVETVEELFPDVVAVDAEQSADGTWTFAVTLSSPYDTPARYADAWRVRGSGDGDGDGDEVYGVRELTHDHQNEQPFTRSHSGIVIPDEVSTVVVEGRDQVSGWGGDTIEFQLP